MTTFSVLFSLFLVFFSANARISGVYYDNGVDQTVIQKLLSKREKIEVEHEILNLLGLPTRPRPRPNLPVHLTGSAPKFLYDVYKSLLESQNTRTTRSEFTLNNKDQQAIDESDVIMSFIPQDNVEGMRHERGKRLRFDVSEVPVEDNIVGAELRIYKSANWTHRYNNPVSYTVTIYQVISDARGQRELQYVDSANTTQDDDRWLLFNVAKPLSNWVAIPDTNLGLYISVSAHSSPSREVKPEEIGVVHSKTDAEHQPFMVAFFKSGIRDTKRRTREANSRRRKKKSENNPGESNYHRNPFLHPNSHWTSRSCQMQNLYVSFKDLEWQDWIIAPDGYQAFYCSGECNFPLNAHMNATNHAIVQTLVHLMNPTHVPKPCCAPTKLSAISVLYFLEDSNVILKKYKNMVVKSCGCH